MCCVGSGRRDGLITRPEESIGCVCLFVCGLEPSRMRRPGPELECRPHKKKKIRLCPRHEGSRGIAPLILNLGARWRCVGRIAPWSLYPRKELRCQLGRKPDGTQKRSRRFGGDKNLFFSGGICTPDYPARILVTLPTTQHRFPLEK